MAMMLRNENELATLRCGLRVESRRAFIATQPFLGARALAVELLTPIEEMGFVSGSSGRSLLEGRPGHLPSDVLRLLDSIDAAVEPGVPLWLQVERDAQIAAAFPWEAHLGARFGRSVFRIPNYLDNPWTPRVRTRLAICVPGQPAQAGLDSLNEFLRVVTRLVTARRGQIPVLDITVFTDTESHAGFQVFARRMMRDMNLKILVPPPQEAVDHFGPPGTTALSESSSQNPWLAWMSHHYASKGVDVVHFICPAHTARGRSALALPVSLIRDHESTWAARLVEIEELAAFYDRLGCAIMSFTARGAPILSESIRTLAYQLAWTRPGPIIVDDVNVDAAALSALWRMLLIGGGLSPPISLAVPCYVHPALTKMSKTIEALQAPAQVDGEVLSYDSGTTDRSLSDGVKDWILSQRNGASLVPESVIAAVTRAWHDWLHPAAEALTDRIIDSQRARLSTTTPRSALEEARDRGTKAALDFLDEVLKR